MSSIPQNINKKINFEPHISQRILLNTNKLKYPS